MFGAESNGAWQRLGNSDPYFAVWTEDRFRTATTPGPVRDEFFASGEAHISDVFSLIRSTLVPNFAPRRALDFGCGVGRITIPLARQVEEVVGVDISSAVLEEARRNCEISRIDNVVLIESDDDLSQTSGNFDFIHSYVVFQHIPRRRGEQIIQTLAAKLSEGGVGALHLVYASTRPRWRVAISDARRRVPLLHALMNVARGRRPTYPLMQMNQYNLNRLFKHLQQSGFEQLSCSFSDHSGYLGAMICFRKSTGL